MAETGFSESLMARSYRFKDPADLARFHEGLRLAGLFDRMASN